MKKYIKASSRTLPFPTVGSGQDADKRNGKIGFGRGYTITMDNGGTFKPITAKVVFDANTGGFTTSVNFSVALDSARLSTEFTGYTPEECSQVYKTVSSMTTEELFDFLTQYEERFNANIRKNNLEYHKRWLENHPDDEDSKRQIDKYEGKIDDEGYWLE